MSSLNNFHFIGSLVKIVDPSRGSDSPGIPAWKLGSPSGPLTTPALSRNNLTWILPEKRGIVIEFGYVRLYRVLFNEGLFWVDASFLEQLTPQAF